MSDAFGGYDGYSNYEDQARQESNGLKALREKAEADSKRIKELESELSKFREKETRSTVASVLTELGAKPTLARFALADGVKPEKDAVAAWLQENGSDFGWTPAEQEPTTATAPAQPAAVQQAAPSVDPAVVAALQQILGAQSSGSPAALADLEAKVSAASSQEELLTLIQNS